MPAIVGIVADVVMKTAEFGSVSLSLVVFQWLRPLPGDPSRVGQEDTFPGLGEFGICHEHGLKLVYKLILLLVVLIVFAISLSFASTGLVVLYDVWGRCHDLRPYSSGLLGNLAGSYS